MRQRGRKSSASLSLVQIDARQRPEPPKRLLSEERQVWRQITSGLRPDWFWASEHLLELLCRAIVHERWLADLIRAADPASKRFKDLVQMQRAEAALIGNLSTKLRLTPRSTFDRYTPKVVSRLPRPWELGGERSDPTAPLSNGLTFDEEARLNKSPEDEAPQPPPKPAA